MPTQRFPIVTLAILVAIAGLYWVMPNGTPLYFNTADIARGEFWRLVTGHFSHADPTHLLWNGLGLAVLGVLIERRSVALLCVTLGTGIVAVNLLLLSPFSQIAYYCGLSGTLNTLLVVALWLEWRASRSFWVAVVAFGSVLKVVIEIISDTSILTNISWPPYAWSHAAGLLGGLLVVLVSNALGRQLPSCAKTNLLQLAGCDFYGSMQCLTSRTSPHTHSHRSNA